MGLLSHIEESSRERNDTASMSFLDFSDKFSLKHTAVFSKAGNNYIITHSIGLDADTVFSSFSTGDFWDGMTKTGQWNVFSKKDNSILPFQQFFSNTLKDRFNFILTYSTGSNILFLCDEKENNVYDKAEIERYFKNINLKSYEAECFSQNKEIKTSSDNIHSVTLNFRETLSDFFNKLPENNTFSVFFKSAVVFELIYKIYAVLPENISITSASENELKIRICSEGSFSGKLYSRFFNNILKTLLGESVELISYECN